MPPAGLPDAVHDVAIAVGLGKTTGGFSHTFYNLVTKLVLKHLPRYELKVDPTEPGQRRTIAEIYMQASGNGRGPPVSMFLKKTKMALRPFLSACAQILALVLNLCSF